MGRRKSTKQASFYEHAHAEQSTTRRYHANTSQVKRLVQLELHSILPAAGLYDNNDASTNANPAHTDFDEHAIIQDDAPPEVIEHQIAGITVVARGDGTVRKRYDTTVSNLPTILRTHDKEPLLFPGDTVALFQAVPPGIP